MDRADFLRAMRGVAHSVSVVTTEGSAGRFGATVSAFSSVSADPPSVLVCLNLSSRITNAVLQNKVFNINVLQQGSEVLAQRFAGAHDDKLENRFEGVELLNSIIPAIAGSVVFECNFSKSMTCGSHEVIVGAVNSIIEGGEKPLAYMDGEYHKVVPTNA